VCIQQEKLAGTETSDNKARYVNVYVNLIFYIWQEKLAGTETSANKAQDMLDAGAKGVREEEQARMREEAHRRGVCICVCTHIHMYIMYVYMFMRYICVQERAGTQAEGGPSPRGIYICTYTHIHMYIM